jgi:hypothetical protein
MAAGISQPPCYHLAIAMVWQNQRADAATEAEEEGESDESPI